MSVPHLIHPILCVVEQISKGTTIYDEDTREPIQQADRATAVSIMGQPRWRRRDVVSMQRGGDRQEAKAYIVFRKVDMDALLGDNVQFQLGDKVTRIGHQTVEYFIIEREWLAHLPAHGGPSLLRAWLSDRNPSKRSND